MHIYRWHDGNLTVVKASTFITYNNLTILEQIKYFTGVKIPQELIDGFRHPQNIKNLEDARSIIGITLLLLKSTENWGLNSQESVAIMQDFLRILKTAAKAVKKQPFVLIRMERWGVFLKHYVKLWWGSVLNKNG